MGRESHSIAAVVAALAALLSVPGWAAPAGAAAMHSEVLVENGARESGRLSYSAEGAGGAGTADAAACLAAEEAMRELGVVVNKRGNVFFYDDRLFQARVTLGMVHGLRPGARVAFVHRDSVVAAGTVTVVRDSFSYVRPDDDTPGGAIQPGDEVRVTLNGTRAAVDAQVAGEKNRRTFLSILVYGMFIALIC